MSLLVLVQNEVFHSLSDQNLDQLFQQILHGHRNWDGSDIWCPYI